MALFQRMAALRKQSVALRRGGCQVLYASGETLVFVRLYQQEQVLVALQRRQRPRSCRTTRCWRAARGGV